MGGSWESRAPHPGLAGSLEVVSTLPCPVPRNWPEGRNLPPSPSSARRLAPVQRGRQKPSSLMQGSLLHSWWRAEASPAGAPPTTQKGTSRLHLLPQCPPHLCTSQPSGNYQGLVSELGHKEQMWDRLCRPQGYALGSYAHGFTAALTRSWGQSVRQQQVCLGPRAP